MPLKRWKVARIAVLLPFLAVSPDAFTREVSVPDILFQSDHILEIHITGPISTLLRDRPDDEYLPATIAWSEPDGRTLQRDVGLRTRGNYRRQRKTCPFPPIRLNFKKSQVANTLFHKQDALKLVTHCKDKNDRYTQLVLKEYLTYRMLNALTDLSYRVRLLRVRYSDTESGRADRSEVGIVIEHRDRFSKRTGLPVVELPRTRSDALDPGHTSLVSVFEFMIGNTDYSPIAGARGENCCHNTDLFGQDASRLFAVPYDFDMSGMIDAPYASPNPRFKLRNVRQRLYRGRCMHNGHLAATLQAFRDRRRSLYALIEDQDLLSASAARSMGRYLDSFFDIIDNRENVERKIIRNCLGAS